MATGWITVREAKKACNYVSQLYTSTDNCISTFRLHFWWSSFWLRQDSLFSNLFCITSLQHLLRTSGCSQTLNSYLKNFWRSPIFSSRPGDSRWSQYISFKVLHAPGSSIRLASFASRSFTPLVVNLAEVPELFKYFPGLLERLGFQHLEITSLWRKFHVSCSRTCVVWCKMCDLGFRICDCELCDNDTIDSYKECPTHSATIVPTIRIWPQCILTKKALLYSVLR